VNNKEATSSPGVCTRWFCELAKSSNPIIFDAIHYCCYVITICADQTQRIHIENLHIFCVCFSLVDFLKNSFIFFVLFFFFCVLASKKMPKAYRQRRGTSPTWVVAVCSALMVLLMSSDVCKSQPIKKPPVITYVAGPNQLTLLLGGGSSFRYVSV